MYLLLYVKTFYCYTFVTSYIFCFKALFDRLGWTRWSIESHIDVGKCMARHTTCDQAAVLHCYYVCNVNSLAVFFEIFSHCRLRSISAPNKHKICLPNTGHTHTQITCSSVPQLYSSDEVRLLHTSPSLSWMELQDSLLHPVFKSQLASYLVTFNIRVTWSTGNIKSAVFGQYLNHLFMKLRLL